MTRADRHGARAIIYPSRTEIGIRTASVVMDEGWTPYIQANLVCELPADRSILDLREDHLIIDVRIRRSFGRRWTIADLSADIGGSMAALTSLLDGAPLSAITNTYYSPFNGAQVLAGQTLNARLYVDARRIRETDRSVTITAMSGELLLMRDALVATSPWSPGSTSLKTIVQAVLDRYGATLAEDALDATVLEADATSWRPGVTAMAYLNPLLEAASLRLICDERGVWNLIERQSQTDGSITLTPTLNIVDLEDSMTLDPDVWWDAVVVEYRWVDAFDLQQIAYDVAGENPSRSVLHIVRDNTVFPGAGAAAGILNRAEGRGRTLALDVVSDYNARPGMPAQITPVDGESITGYLSSVTWRFPDAEMQVLTRGLVDIPDTAWGFVPAGIDWADVPAGLSWSEYDPDLIGA